MGTGMGMGMGMAMGLRNGGTQAKDKQINRQPNERTEQGECGQEHAIDKRKINKFKGRGIHPSTASISFYFSSCNFFSYQWRPMHGSGLVLLSRLSHGHHNCHWRNKLFVLTALVTPLPSPSLATLRRINKSNDIGPGPGTSTSPASPGGSRSGWTWAWREKTT